MVGLRGPLKLVDKMAVKKRQKPIKNSRGQPGMPKMPSWLSDAAKREWRRVARPLWERGLLTILDRQAFAQYCSAVARIEEAELALRDGNTYTTQGGRQFLRPEYRILQDAVKEVRAHCVLFGLSPSARMRMQLPEPKQADDGMAGLLD